jgi:hypothetical protein
MFIYEWPGKPDKLNGTRQLLDYADGVNLLGDIIDTIKKHRIFNGR